MKKENWKEILGYKHYIISNFGRVKSLKFGKETILKPMISTNGYLTVCLREKPHKKRVMKIHRLMMIAFTENKENKKDINHKNGIKTDNRIKNLEWCSRSENQKHAYKTGLKFPNVGPALKARGIIYKK